MWFILLRKDDYVGDCKGVTGFFHIRDSFKGSRRHFLKLFMGYTKLSGRSAGISTSVSPNMEHYYG